MPLGSGKSFGASASSGRPGTALLPRNCESGSVALSPAGGSSLRNGGSHDFALGHRYERKFPVPHELWPRLAQVIRSNPALFSRIYQPRAVNNLYFDTPGLGYYALNLAGASRRFKVRVRWYGGLFGELSRPVLELKIKEGLVGTKESYPLTSFQMRSGMHLGLIKQVLRQSELPGHVRTLMATLEPSLLNCYQRAYFQSADRRFRLTLDSDLEFFRVRSGHISSLGRAPGVPFQVLELKYQQEDAEGADLITGSFPFRVSRMSKYALGIESVEDW